MPSLRKSKSKDTGPGPLHIALVCLAGAVGLIATIVGIPLFADAREGRSRHAFVSGLPELSSAPEGAPAFVEGRIAANTAPLQGGFAAWLREGYGRNAGSSKGWNVLGGETQPLTIETASGPVRIVNGGYAFDNAVLPWFHETREESAPTLTAGSVRISGLLPGGTVMSVGTHTGDGLKADSITGLDRKTWLENLQKAGDRIWWISIVLLALGPVLIVLAARAVIRICKTP
jgi:hypothetical protein